MPKSINDLVRGIQEDEARTQSQAESDKIARAIAGINLKVPEVQKMEWGITIDGLKELFAEFFTELRQVVVAMREIEPPEVVMPEPKAEIKVTDLNKVVALLQRLASKPEAKVTIPNFPRKITVDNLDEVVDKLDSLVDKEEKTEERATGYSFEKDESGNLSKVTEMYPSGDVVSEGWNLGRVRITDDRKH